MAGVVVWRAASARRAAPATRDKLCFDVELNWDESAWIESVGNSQKGNWGSKGLRVCIQVLWLTGRGLSLSSLRSTAMPQACVVGALFWSESLAAVSLIRDSVVVVVVAREEERAAPQR